MAQLQQDKQQLRRAAVEAELQLQRGGGGSKMLQVTGSSLALLV